MMKRVSCMYEKNLGKSLVLALFVVLLAIMGVVVYVSQNGKQDIRGRASDELTQICQGLCQNIGSQIPNCVSRCVQALSGTTSCANVCGDLPVGQRAVCSNSCGGLQCVQMCKNISPGAQNICTTECKDVFKGTSSCQRACSGLQKPEDKTLCLTKCHQFFPDK